MNDNQRLRKLLADQPRLTAEEIGHALEWPADQVRNVLSGMLHRGEGVSLPKRYELTELGARRARHGVKTVTEEERRARSIQRCVAFRARQKAKKQAEELRQVQAERQEAVAANDGMVAQAIASRHPLAMAWGGQA